MKMHYKALMLSLALGLSSCGGNNTITQTNEEPTPEQEELVQNGWSSNTPEGGELETEYGIKPIYGIQDNYFDIRMVEGFSVAIKIVDASSEKCIRYVYVPEGESKCAGLIAKKAMNSATQKLEDISKQVEGMIEGFMEGFGEDN